MNKPPKFDEFLPYGLHSLGNEEKNAVVKVLESNWITGGQEVSLFEKEFAKFTNSKYAIACSNGTAALHLCTLTLGIKPGDEVIVPSFSFSATANCVEFQGAKPVFVDISENRLQLDPQAVEKAITKKTKAIITVDYAGLPSPIDELKEITENHNLYLIEDAAHSVGASYKGNYVGNLANLTTFSFHPVKQMTTGEGGMVTTDDEEFAKKINSLRNHGINKDAQERFGNKGSYYYEMKDLGYNYRITDIQCALGRVQLKKLPKFLEKRNYLANYYFKVLESLSIDLPPIDAATYHAWHLFVIRIKDLEKNSRDHLFNYLRENNIGVNVHYIPIHHHPYYKKKYNFSNDTLPITEDIYKRLITLPLFPKMETFQIDLIKDHVEYFLSR
ncbi:MAG: UDP-4-amino-4-deoxy-L-arabinose--oxoglutarate aminotransferase [Candidatus Heimdallarchaeota archaeon LC_3]|nr:MAG: UDP-4-amino-4-deoxy-L-arabinose--oxoglutarate aminotransferase [Candidatus Heimdallarchaeota archaeon LC_3]